MINFIQRLFARYQWRWVGTVEGVTVVVDDNGNTLKSGAAKSTYWNLYMRGDGKRRYSEVGDIFRYYASQQCRATKAKVDAWVYGGPIPQLCDTPTPEKPKPEGKLILLRGGKDNAE